MKRILCITLILLLLLGLSVPVAASDAEAPSDPYETSAPTELPEPTEESTEPTEPTAPTEATEPTEEPTEPEPEPREDELHKPLVSGNPNGSFRPGYSLSRAEISAIIYGLGSYESGPDRFSDVRKNAWYAEAVNAMAAAGVLAGYPDGRFQPTKAVTRAELAAILAALSGEESTAEASFTDVSPKNWAYRSIALAQEKGWVSGYSDGSFRPGRAVTRAEAVAMLLRFLGRTPDVEAIDKGENIRYFPDVQPGRWYYYAVMEAATLHTAHYDTPEADERWLSSEAGNPTVADGFYCFGKQLFLVKGGAYLRTPGSGVYDGVDYVCAGSSGICTARTEVLKLASGELILLTKGKPKADPGSYADGLYLKAGQLYAAVKGSILHKAATGTADGVSYTCTGQSGVCTVSDWTKLKLDGISLSCFDKALTPEASATGSASVTLAAGLRAVVRAYEKYFQVEYPLENASDAAYIQKAMEYGILEHAQSNYQAPLSRGYVAMFLCRAFRGRELEAINSVEGIPDLASDSIYYPYVMKLYEAGIMEGFGTDRNVQITGSVTAEELAALLTRLERRSERVRFTLTLKTVKTLQYGTSGSGRYPLTAYQIGNGKNVMILSFAIHGWEDNWSRDGEELVYLADQTKSYLESHYELVKNGNWTVYIMRCLNPDGLYLGTTNNGPGRCTTTYYNASGKLVSGTGVDMNRCFPYGFKAMTGARNFNGSSPLQCVEAKAIASFVQSHKGSGFNICIDTHGWFGQIITSSGKGTLYNTLLKQFPNSSYASLGGGYGYFSSWTAYSLGFDSCLLELPRGISSHTSFLNAGCVWRFENAIAELLQHYNGPNATRNPRDYVVVELDGN